MLHLLIVKAVGVYYIIKRLNTTLSYFFAFLERVCITLTVRFNTHKLFSLSITYRFFPNFLAVIHFVMFVFIFCFQMTF